jgi:NhaP-type Na+/H+ or K+/H+ antiporter
MLFVMTGTFIGENFAFFENLALKSSDVWKAVLFYVFVFTVRYLVNLFFYPAMNKLGYKLTHASNLILSYGGLRGAIALSLAMIVALDERLNKHFRDLCLFYTVVIILLSILINGMTIKFLMKKTGFLKANLLKMKLHKSLYRQFIIKTLEFESEIKHDKKLNGVNWKDVEKLVHLANYKFLEKIEKRKQKAIKAKKKEMGDQKSPKKSIFDKFLGRNKKAKTEASKSVKNEPVSLKKDDSGPLGSVSPEGNKSKVIRRPMGYGTFVELAPLNLNRNVNGGSMTKQKKSSIHQKNKNLD